jgi:hypothetical protein
MRNSYHTYQYNNRYAEVFKSSKGFEVDLHEDNKLVETREVWNHSESYAEEVADNWVQGIIKIEANPNDKGYYGYNQKTQNFYPGLDD